MLPAGLCPCHVAGVQSPSPVESDGIRSGGGVHVSYGDDGQ